MSANLPTKSRGVNNRKRIELLNDYLDNRSWEWFDGEFKAYCADNQDYKRIMSWQGVKEGGTYYFPDGAVRHDVIIPYRLFNKVAELLGLLERVPDCCKRQFAGP